MKTLNLEQFDDDALLLSYCDECIKCVTSDGVPVYSYELLVSAFMESGMTEDEAVEWIDYNVMGLEGNGKFFVAHDVMWEVNSDRKLTEIRSDTDRNYMSQEIKSDEKR